MYVKQNSHHHTFPIEMHYVVAAIPQDLTGFGKDDEMTRNCSQFWNDYSSPTVLDEMKVHKMLLMRQKWRENMKISFQK